MMREALILVIASLSLTYGLVAQGRDKAEGLRNPAEFAGIHDREARSVALFEEMAKVITSPRCMNCHPRDDSPRQGDDMHMHRPPVIRGESNFGAPGMHCTTCHGAEVAEFVGSPGSIPGHTPWQLAPLSMGWIGMTHGEICRQLKDTDRNGGRSLEDLVEHHATDALVGSAWHHGNTKRTPLPGSQKIFANLTRAWVDTGAACPD